MTLIAWLIILAAAAGAILTGIQAGSHAGEQDYHRARVSVVAAASLACLAVCAAGIAGVLPGIPAAILAAVAAFTALGAVWYEQGTRNGDSARLGVIMADAVAAARMAARKPRRVGGPATEPAVIPGEAEDVTPRMVPPVRLDPALDEPAAGETAVTPGHVPPQWGALASFIAGFEPEDDAAELGFLRDTSAGILAVADAFRAHAENCGEGGAGLDPAFVQAVLEAGDSVGDCAHDVALARRRFLVVYQEVLEAVRAGLRLPHKARQFLTGETGEAA